LARKWSGNGGKAPTDFSGMDAPAFVMRKEKKEKKEKKGKE
jgi:hypothetical protein